MGKPQQVTITLNTNQACAAIESAAARLIGEGWRVQSTLMPPDMKFEVTFRKIPSPRKPKLSAKPMDREA